MGNNWPKVKIGFAASPIERSVVTVPGTQYRQIGVRLWGQGAYERETIDGSQTRYSKFNQVESGDIVVNKIWARNGSVAVVTDNLAGCYGSGEFPTFAPDRQKLEPAWFHWITKTKWFWDACDEKSRGTSGKNRIRPEKFLDIEIPLPPLEEQRRIVARIDALAERISEVQRLRREVSDLQENLLRNFIADIRLGNCVPTPMSELVRLRHPDVTVEPHHTYQFAGVYSFGRGVFRGPVKLGSQFAYKKLTRLHKDDFVYPKLMAWEGAYGIVPAELDGLVVSTEYPVFELIKGKILPEVITVHFSSPVVWEGLSNKSIGTNVRRRRLNPKDLLNYIFPLAPMENQLRLREKNQKISVIRTLNAEIQRDLEALLPGILNKAFKGEL
jgi:type I restriction enzyme, S subunit